MTPLAWRFDVFAFCALYWFGLITAVSSLNRYVMTGLDYVGCPYWASLTLTCLLALAGGWAGQRLWTRNERRDR